MQTAKETAPHAALRPRNNAGLDAATTVTVGGKPYAVHTDYRDILDIIDHLQNTDDNEQERWYIAMALFYENWRDIPAQNRQEAAERMAEFIACGKTQGKPGAKREIDWQQDAELIVGGVNKVAGCEVRALPTCTGGHSLPTL